MQTSPLRCAQLHTNLTVYYRSTTGVGLFEPQTNNAYYNPVTGKLVVSLSLTASNNDLSEVIFGSPDIAEVPYPPILNAVENYRGIQPYEVIAPAAAGRSRTQVPTSSTASACRKVSPRKRSNRRSVLEMRRAEADRRDFLWSFVLEAGG